MAETLPTILEQELLGIKTLLWGRDIKSDVFKRWSQGFHFSASEPSALEQTQGGPCAVIAPVQAFLIKNLLLEFDSFVFRDAVTEDMQIRILIGTMCEILEQCRSEKFKVVYLASDDESKEIVNGDGCENGVSGSVDSRLDVLSLERFHKDVRIRLFTTIDEVEKYYFENRMKLKEQFGILTFLYSVIATRGLQEVRSESDTSDPLIDNTYGYGSQSLINLMITGRAVTYVWDNDQDVGGLKLSGIRKQSQIGFITLMEHLRYCTVGSFYKNPVHPVWVLGSETHLTVLFSDERRLVSKETKSEHARRVFKSYDPDGNNFISSALLQDVLRSLDMVCEKEYVDIMRQKLDSENLGIILLNAFMDEFFPKEERSTPDMFPLYHYNGLAQSNVNGQIRYHIGSAILLESDLKSVCEWNPMLTCLQTKWPNIEVTWCDNVTPSLN